MNAYPNQKHEARNKSNCPDNPLFQKRNSTKIFDLKRANKSEYIKFDYI
jgi:hypothetical protein